MHVFLCVVDNKGLIQHSMQQLGLHLHSPHRPFSEERHSNESDESDDTNINWLYLRQGWFEILGPLQPAASLIDLTVPLIHRILTNYRQRTPPVSCWP